MIGPPSASLMLQENPNIKKRTNRWITARNFRFNICIQIMVDKILISENYYIARNKTIENILSKLTHEINP